MIRVFTTEDRETTYAYLRFVMGDSADPIYLNDPGTDPGRHRWYGDGICPICIRRYEHNFGETPKGIKA